MRERYAPSPVAIALAALLMLLLAASPAAAGWGPDGVTISATTASIPIVEGCSDGAYGTFVAWQEESAPGQGVLRLQHVLSTGDIDPAWPAAGAVACAIVAGRSEVAIVPDHLGGVYLVWKEGTALYASRVDAAGALATGWPSRGRSLGTVSDDSPRPSVIEDGGTGFYAAWRTGGLSEAALAMHLGPDNLGVAGWPNGTRTVGPSTDVPSAARWPQLALAPDGGVFVAFAFQSTDEEAVPSAYRLRRLTAAGLVAAGWGGAGIDVAPFHHEYLGATSRSALVGLAPDGRGGVFLMQGDITDGGGNPAGLETRLHRLQSDGTPAADWPAVPPIVPGAFATYYDIGVDGGYRIVPDGEDGAYAGHPAHYDHFTSFAFQAFQAHGTPTTTSSSALALEPPLGMELAEKGAGLFAAFFHGNGAYQPYDYNAFLAVNLSPCPTWCGWSESHPEIVVSWYGDIGLASSGDGGAVLFWSQVRERIGLFARRFTEAGQVTGVGPSLTGSLALGGLRFVLGAGVRGSLRVPDGASARLTLHDVAGRRVASEAVGAGTREHTLAGTSALPSGLYFARLVAGGEAVSGKVFVAR